MEMAPRTVLHPAATPGMGVDGDVLQEAAGGVHCRQLGAGAQPRVDPQHPPAPRRGEEEEVAQVVAEDLDGGLVGPVLRLQAELHLDGRGDEPLVGVLGHPLEELGEDALFADEEVLQAGDDLLHRGGDGQVEDLLLLPPAHGQHPVGGGILQGLLVVVVHLVLGDRLLLVSRHPRGEDPLLGGEAADKGPGGGVVGEALGEDVAGPLQGGGRVGHPLLRVDEGEGGLLRGLLRGAAPQLLEEDQLGKGLKAPLLGDGRLGAALGLVGEVEVLQQGLLPAGLDPGGQLGGELTLFGDGGEDGLLPLGQLGVVGEEVGQVADLHLVQFAGHLLAVAGDEGDGRPLPEEFDGAPHLAWGEA